MVEYVVNNIVEIFAVITGLVTLAAAVAALTPTPKDDKIVSKIRKVVDILAINFGHAKNLEEAEKERKQTK